MGVPDETESAKQAFFYGSWHAAAAVTASAAKNPRVWENLADLYKYVLAIENRTGLQRQEDLRDFLEFEAEQFRPGGSAEKEGRAQRPQLVPKEPTMTTVKNRS